MDHQQEHAGSAHAAGRLVVSPVGTVHRPGCHHVILLRAREGWGEFVAIDHAAVVDVLSRNGSVTSILPESRAQGPIGVHPCRSCLPDVEVHATERDAVTDGRATTVPLAPPASLERIETVTNMLLLATSAASFLRGSLTDQRARIHATTIAHALDQSVIELRSVATTLEPAVGSAATGAGIG